MPQRCRRRIPSIVSFLFLLGATRCIQAFFDTSAGATARYGTGSSTLLSIYQKYVSPLKGGNTCSMYPACSQFAKYAFERSDPASAFLSVCDRLVRCGRDASTYPLIITSDGPKLYDPPQGMMLAGPVAFAAPFFPEQAGAPDSGCVTFARALLAEKKYVVAALEFERIARFSVERPCRRTALLGSLECSYLSDNLTAFLDAFYRVTDSLSGDTAAIARCGILLGKRYYDAGDLDGSIDALRHYSKSSDPDRRAERYFLTSLCYVRQRRPEQAIASADSIPPESVYRALFDSLRTSERRLYSGERSPMLSGMLSMVLPGAGYFYAGKPVTGTASLLINGLLVWATYDFINSGHFGAAASACFIGSGFYFGNIRGSIKAVRLNTMSARKRKCDAFIEALHFGRGPLF